MVASRGTDMKMDRAYLGADSNQTICCWNAPDVAKLEELFKSAETPFEKMYEVEEFQSANFS